MTDDIYFLKPYAKLYENIEHGIAEEYTFTCPLGTIKNLFIKREIPQKIDCNTLYDITTPYGYGGPRVVTLSDESKKRELINLYAKDFCKYCKSNNIVSEFVRFHPIMGNGLDFKEVYNAEHIRNTLGTDLKKYDDPIAVEFSKGCRKNIRQAVNKGVSWRITLKPSNIDNFIKIYYSTMDRNHALDYYYFDEEYFEKLLNTIKENILFVEAIFEEKTIAAGLYFVFDKYIHIHLSGTLTEYLYLSPAYILRYATTLWGKENGYEMIHHGGGRTNSPEDSLYKFKKQFGQNTEFEFYIGKKIWEPDIYNVLCRNITQESDYFPAYRALR